MSNNNTTTTPEIKTYPLLTHPTAQTHALAILKPHLPVCIPLYRRLQFGRFFPASLLLSNLDLNTTNTTADGEGEWLIAFIDRSTRPETEVWFSASWESSQNSLNEESCDALVLAAVKRMRELGVPSSIHQDVLDAQAAELKNASAIANDNDSAGFSRRDYAGHASDGSIMLWGAVHERTVPILQRLGLLARKLNLVLQPNFTFIWDVDALPPAKPLPEGLRWGTLEERHFPLVRARTQIPRQDRTLAALPNLGIFPTDGEGEQPVAWAFVGLDASLTTLHVETAWRGRGLAKAVTTKLFREAMGRFWEEGDGGRRWAHGYVIVGNRESEGMCRSLGGRSEWEVFWTRVDLGGL